MHSVEALLKKYKLRNTPIRRTVLTIFNGLEHALSHSDLEKKLQEKFDRVTIYRTLKTFEDKGVIHRIINDQGILSYALCKSDCAEEDHKHLDDHIHFQCEKCKRTFCLEHHPTPYQKLFPAIEDSSYKINSIQILAIGICPNCQSPTT